ncbi:23669_t:CDS:10 [Cetraspora pellucida]|uniref:23669_t:CDS:1 n=1 Tax=Cetraspora pellucida TaxID=1433469 RepID=A0A9N8WDM8_9GLOM|nr:23669_t:CDS:10 [Cetraspora pellucida]
MRKNGYINLPQFSEFTPLDNTYISLNNKLQSSCLDLTLKFGGYIFDNNIVIKKASKQAFTIDVDKVESKTEINNEIENVEKCDSKLEALLKRNFISCKNISNLFPCLSVFLGAASCKTLDYITTVECSYRKWEKEELKISKSNINPTNNFIMQVENALESDDKEAQLRRVSNEFGNFYARRLVFGGAMIEEIIDIDDSQNYEIRVIGGNKEYTNINSSLKPWVMSLNNRDTWDIIEYDEIYSIFDILDYSLQQTILDVLGHRILKAGINDIPINWDFSNNAPYVHSLAPQFTGLDKITKITNCYIFASILDKKDRDIFSLRIGYIDEHTPLFIVHLKKPSYIKKYKNYPIKYGWIIVGQPTNFDFDRIKYPVVLKSGELPTSNVDKLCKIEFSKYRELNTCALGQPEIKTALFCCFNDIDKSFQSCEFEQVIVNWQKDQNKIRLDTSNYQYFIQIVKYSAVLVHAEQGFTGKYERSAMKDLEECNERLEMILIDRKGAIKVEKDCQNPVPLQDVSVDANIVDMIAETTVCQTYKNVEQNTIEAIYKFPLHEAAAVCGFEAEIDGKKKVKGIVKDAKQATKEYDEAIQKGHGAYLLEEQLPDVFQCSVGNITAGQTVVIRITYVTELKHDADSEKVRFVYPTHIAPRYGSSNYSPANDGKKLIPDKVSYGKADYYLDLNITCRMTSIIQSIESPSHHISTELNIDGDPKVSKITLAEQITYLEKDFILVVKSLDLDQPRAFVEYNPKTETNCVMLTLVPKFAINAIMTELIFVIDRSGSMSGGTIKKASEALQLLLRSLPEDCFFNVVSFGSDFDSLFKKSQPYSEGSFSKALKHAQEMTANYGGTEIYNPIKWAFENSRNDMPTSVFLLTDGQVYNVDQIVNLIKSCEEKKKDDLRFFSIGIGCSVSHHLVESVSRAGKGYAQFVTNTERMDKKILGMLKNAIKPPIKDYNITWTDQIIEDSLPMEISTIDNPTISFFSDNTRPPPANQDILPDIKIQQAPFLIPPIYPGARYIVYCILEKNVEACKEIILSANSHDGPMKLSIPLDPVILQGSKIHTLAARKLIQDLEEGTSFIHKHPMNEGKNIQNTLVREHIVNLGVTYSLASKYTRDMSVTKVKSLPDQRIIPISSASVKKRRKTHATARSLSVTSKNRNLRTKQTARKSTGGTLSSAVESSSILVSPPSSLPGSAPCAVPYQLIMQDSNQSLVQVLPTATVKSKPPIIETLYSFLDLQSFDGSFLPSSKFYSWFDKNGFKDFEVIEIENEKVLCLTLAIAYLEIIMFETFKDECELCYEKAKKILKKEVGDERKINEISKKVKEWVKMWVDE